MLQHHIIEPETPGGPDGEEVATSLPSLGSSRVERQLTVVNIQVSYRGLCVPDLHLSRAGSWAGLKGPIQGSRAGQRQKKAAIN